MKIELKIKVLNYVILKYNYIKYTVIYIIYEL